MKASEVFRQFPELPACWETSDGLFHLREEDARAQADHLAIQSVKKHDKPKPAARKNQPG